MIDLPDIRLGETADLPVIGLGASVELEVGGYELDLDASVELNGHDKSALERANRAAHTEWYAPRTMRIPFALNITGAVGGSAFPITPVAQGRKLELKRIYINIAAPVSQGGPGTVELYLVAQPSGFNTGGPNPTDPLNLSSANIIHSWKQAPPMIQTWGRFEAVVYPPEMVMLVAWVGGSTSAFQLAGNLSVLDTPFDEFGVPTITRELHESHK